jgi:sugar lactone lactonase YvrE
MNNSLIHLLPVQNRLGEGPVWNTDEQTLYWVDIEGKAYHRYTPSTGMHERIEVGVMLGVLRFRASGGLVMATCRGIQFWDPASRQLTPLVNPEDGKPDARFNDGAVDPQGRFWAGTMAPGTPSSSLYRLDPDHTLHRMDTGIGTSNGIAWSLDSRTLYYTDSPLKVIYAYDFDPHTGKIENRRPFIHTPDEPGFPDGLIVDSEGFLWSARWGGWKINRYDPAGKKEREVAVPAEFTTSCAFGGPDLTDLYITTAWTELGADHARVQPYSGDIFLLHTAIRGQVEPKYAG